MNPDQARSDHARGVMLAVIAVTVLSPESLLIRLVEADRWTLAFWRGILMAIGLTAATMLLHRSPAPIRIAARRGLPVAGLFAAQSVLFIVSITNTSVANTLAVLSAAPLFAALYGRFLFGERISARTWATIGIAMGGIAVLFSGSLTAGSWFGDLAAMGAAMSFGGVFVAIRRRRNVDMVPAMGIGGLLAALAVSPFAEPMSASLEDARYLALSGLAVLPVAFGLLAVAPRYISAPEVALITLLEVVLGPLWVWLVLGERPGVMTLVGGSVVVTAVGAHALWRERPPVTLDRLAQASGD